MQLKRKLGMRVFLRTMNCTRAQQQVGLQIPLFVYVLIFISPVSFPRFCPSLEAETWRRTAPHALSATNKHSVSDIHMYVCKRSRHLWTLCEGHTILVFQI